MDNPHIEFTTYIEVPVKVQAKMHPEQKGGRHIPYIPEHAETVELSFDPDEVQAELNRVAEQGWVGDLVLDKVGEQRSEALVDAMRGYSDNE